MGSKSTKPAAPAPTATPAFVWTEELEAAIPPFRGQGPAPAVKKVEHAALFAGALAARKEYKARKSLVALMTSGEGSFDDEADAFLLACSAPRSGKGAGTLDGLSPADAEKVAFAGVDRWIERHGAAGAVDIFTRVGAWKPTRFFAYGRTRVLAAIRLRQRLAHASDYQAALDYVVANDGLPNGMPGWRPNEQSEYNAGREAMAYLFPDHRPLFEAAIEQVLANDWITTMLLGGVSSAEDVDRLAPHTGFGDWNLNALVVARQARERALAHLVAKAEDSDDLRTGVPRALTAYVAPQAAAALATYVEKSAAHPLLRAYFTAHPALVAAALKPLTAHKSKKTREGAAALLAVL